MEYEMILLGKRVEFSSTYIKKDTSEDEVRPLLRYVFQDLLGWGAQDIYHYATPKLIQKLHLARVIRKIEYPPELNRNKDLFYLAQIVYPESIHIPQAKLILTVYQRVLSGEMKKFPKNFFLATRSDMYLNICMEYAIEHFLPVYDLKTLYQKFSDTDWAMQFLKRVRLDDPCKSLFEYPIDMFHESLREEQKNTLYYMNGRCHAAYHQIQKEEDSN